MSLRSRTTCPAVRRTPSKEEVLGAAVDGIAGLLVQMGRMRDDRRNAEGRLRRQLTSQRRWCRTRTRVAAMADRTRIGSAASDALS